MENVLSTFTEERPVFLKEYGAGYYTVSAYFLSKVLIEVHRSEMYVYVSVITSRSFQTPFAFISPSLIALITYWIIGFRGNFLIYLTFLILASLNGVAIGMFGR